MSLRRCLRLAGVRSQVLTGVWKSGTCLAMCWFSDPFTESCRQHLWDSQNMPSDLMKNYNRARPGLQSLTWKTPLGWLRLLIKSHWPANVRQQTVTVSAGIQVVVSCSLTVPHSTRRIWGAAWIESRCVCPFIVWSGSLPRRLGPMGAACRRPARLVVKVALPILHSHARPLQPLYSPNELVGNFKFAGSDQISCPLAEKVHRFKPDKHRP